jgi:hypothetical protein
VLLVGVIKDFAGLGGGEEAETGEEDSATDHNS